jgi:hypothetical protein
MRDFGEAVFDELGHRNLSTGKNRNETAKAIR